MALISAKLLLQSGESFQGLSFPWQKEPIFGEAVFTTAMTGYVESLTDPSYAGQLIVFSYPLIGNYGVPSKSSWQSKNIQAAGVVIGKISPIASHRDSEFSFLEWLEKERVPLLTEVDTRAVVKALRKKGAALGAICPRDTRIRQFPDFPFESLIKKVTPSSRSVIGSGAKTILALDCGMKKSLTDHLLKRGARIIQVPFDYNYLNEDYDALFLSNGPGNPMEAEVSVALLKQALTRKKPIFGVCLGMQLLALAIGAKVYKLPFSHRGINHPCRNLEQNRSLITSQNHGYGVDETTLPKDWKATFIHLHDGSLEGMAHRTLPFFAVQFHPEGSPGPSDADYLFDRFFDAVQS